MEVPCVNGDADKIRSANYETVLKGRIFFLFGPRLFLLKQAETEIRFSMANGTFKMKMGHPSPRSQTYAQQL